MDIINMIEYIFNIENIEDLKEIKGVEKANTLEYIKKSIIFTILFKRAMYKNNYFEKLTPTANNLLIVILYRVAYINTLNNGINKRVLNSIEDNKYIKARCGLTEKEYYTNLKELHQKGFIRIEKDTKKNIYYYFLSFLK